MSQAQDGAATHTAELIWQQDAARDGVPVWCKTLAPSGDPLRAAALLQHEAELIQAHGGPGLLRLQAIERVDGRAHSLIYTALPGAWAADMPRPSVAQAVQWAIHLAETLGRLHLQQVQLRNLQLSHVWIAPDRPYVTSLSRAISRGREHLAPVAVHLLQGDLRVLAPEQSGRLNRSSDYRADYYRLGVLLYWWLTGDYPFSGQDAVGLVYQHLASAPESPSLRAPAVPKRLSAIVLKLLAKNPDARYQSAEGLIADLGDLHSALPLGAHDVPYQFNLAQRLYGRDVERVALLEQWERVATGRPQALFLGGYSGVGKTTLIRETYLPATRARASFVAGKFDQLQQRAPYSAWLQALGALVRDVTSLPAEAQQARALALQAELAKHAAVLVALLPELATLLGQQPPPPVLPPTDAQERLHAAVIALLRAFAQAEHPLLLFLDDLQWADGASLRLINVLLTGGDVQHLFLIGAYRDNEVDHYHPFSRLLRGLPPQPRMEVKSLALAPLGLAPLQTLLSDSLRRDAAELELLAGLVFRKTGGNPFFVWQLLRSLRTEGVIFFSRPHLRWEWHLEAVNRAAYAESVLHLMQQRFSSLPADCQEALSLGACLGAEFALADLAALTAQTPAALVQTLQAALQEEFVLPVGEEVVLGLRLTAARLRFVHDRMQEAAYHAIPDSKRAERHWRIAEALLARTPPDVLPSEALTIADHLQRGRTLLPLERRLEAAEVQLLAAQQAREAAAFDAAAGYARQAIELLPPAPDAWQDCPDLARRVYRMGGELEPLAGRLDAGRQLVETAISLELDVDIRLGFYLLLISQHTIAARYAEAIDAGRAALASVGWILPTVDYERARDHTLAAVQKRVEDDLLRLARLGESPLMQDARSKAVMSVLIAMGPPCYRSHPGLWGVIVAQEMLLCLEQGVMPSATYTLPAYGGLRQFVGSGSGAECATLARATALLYTRGGGNDEAVAHLMMGSSLRHWIAPLREATQDYLNGYQAGLASGNLQYAVYCFGHNAYCRFWQGIPLPDLIAEVESSLPFAEARQNRWGCDVMEGVLRIARMHLPGLPAEGAWADADYEERCRRNGNAQALCIYRLMQAEAAIFEADYRAASVALLRAEPDLALVSIQGLLPSLQAQALGQLLRVMQQDDTHGVRAPLATLQRWVAEGAVCIAPTVAWIEAEQHWQQGDWRGAELGFERALAMAEAAHHHPRALAIAHRYAKLWQGRGQSRVAAMYERVADEHRARWYGELRGDGQRRGEAQLLQLIQSQPTGLALEGTYATLLRTAQLTSNADRAVLIIDTPEAEVLSLDSAQGGEHLLPVRDRLNLPTAWLLEALQRQEVRGHVRGGGSAMPAGMLTAVRAAYALPLQRGDQGKALLYLELSGEELSEAWCAALTAQLSAGLQNADWAKRLIDEASARAAMAERAEAARQEAERANRAKSDFLAAMSHEIRTPLNGMLGVVRLLSESGTAPEQAHLLDMLQRSGDSLRSVVNDILDFARLEAGQAELHITPFSLTEMLHALADFYRPAAEAKNLLLVLEPLPKPLPRVLGDAAKLRQLLGNLLSNGIKFTEAGEVHVLLTVVEASPTQLRLRLSVQDSGVGIRGTDMERLFLPFSRVNEQQRGNGTGLGLATAKRLAQLMGGEVRLRSHYGVGTEAQVDLAFSYAPAVAPAPEAPPALRAGRVLLVEDHPVNAFVAKKYLEALGQSVEIASDGRVALERMLRGDVLPDVVLMDLHMPVMDGFEATAKIRAAGGAVARVPIVALTADVVPEARKRCEALGMEGWLTKPTSREDLAHMLARWLSAT